MLLVIHGRIWIKEDIDHIVLRKCPAAMEVWKAIMPPRLSEGVLSWIGRDGWKKTLGRKDGANKIWLWQVECHFQHHMLVRSFRSGEMLQCSRMKVSTNIKRLAGFGGIVKRFSKLLLIHPSIPGSWTIRQDLYCVGRS